MKVSQKINSSHIEPFLSIVIPTFNRPDYLKLCLESVNNQIQHSNMVETIVVDDFSELKNYNTNQSLCNVYGFTCIRHKKNLGVGSARNTGIKNSNGKWIAFLDDDVRVNESWLSNLLSFLPNLTPDIIAVEGKVESSGDGIWDKEVENLHGKKYLTCNYCIQKEILILVNGFDSFFKRSCDDHEITSRLLSYGKIVFNPEISVTHLPRNVSLFKYIISSHSRISTLLDAEYHFYKKNPTQYYKFRASHTFWGTYFRIIWRNIINNLRRRNISSILKHPLASLVLIVTSIIEQLFALFMLPHFLRYWIKDHSKSTLNNNDSLPHPKKALTIWFAGFISQNSYGGVNRSMTELANAMTNLGHSTRIIYKNKYENFLTFSIRIGLLLCFSSKSRPDWIIARSTDSAFCAIACKIFRFKTKIALHNHGWEEKVLELKKLLPQKIITNPTTWKAKIVRFPLLRLNLKLSSLCICGTVEEARWIKKHYPFTSNKLGVITNGTELNSDMFWTTKKILPFNFLIIGGHTWRKNLRYGIDIFNNIHKLIPESRLFLVGTGNNITLDNTDNSITIIKDEPLKNMYKWYQTCPFLISASRYEGGYSLAILEALSYGMIAFVTSIPSTTEFITNLYNGILLSGINTNSDTQKVLNAIQNNNLLHKISTNACKYASRHSWQRQGLRLETLLINHA